MRNTNVETVINDEVLLKSIFSLEQMMDLHIDILIDTAAELAAGKNMYEIPGTIYYALSRLPLGLILAHKKKHDMTLLLTYISSKLSEFGLSTTPSSSFIFHLFESINIIDEIKKELNDQKYEKLF